MQTPAPEFYIGLDLGQAADYTAVTILERFPIPERERADGTKARYHLRHIERFPLRTPYPEIVERVDALSQADALRGRVRILVDKTGVGAPVTDMLRQTTQATVTPITITGGTEHRKDGSDYFVPKRDLVSTVQVLLQNGHLRFAEGLPLADVLLKELRAFKVKINVSTGHDGYEAWREGDHDDLVLSLCLACWYGERAAYSWLF